ncbi:hypothetical protein HN803_01060 [candidate division WWE3 bacterium]|jgi:hypothetical protein|nr:hypothetical protein [candidate division WWE3 bacterium]MBT7349364.1 hypothetical protein [candidate division WWE3 bacterium]
MAPIPLGNIAIKVLLVVVILFAVLKFGGKVNSGAAVAEVGALVEAATGKKPDELFTPKSLLFLFIGLIVFGIIISIINYFKPV